MPSPLTELTTLGGGVIFIDVPPNEERSIERSGVIERVTALLDAFDVQRPTLTLGEAAERAGLSSSTARRLLVQLAEAGLIRQDPETRRYSLGLKFVRYGSVALETADIVRIARPSMERLTEQFQEATFLGQLEPVGVVYLAVHQPSVPVRVSTRAGEIRPAHSTSIGKVLLAALDDDELDQWLANHELTSPSPETLSEPDALRADLTMVRERGYAVNYRESSRDFASAAAPVYDSRHRVVAALAISGPSYRIARDQLSELGEATIASAAEISRGFGAAVT